jgi:hypothetical protein
MNDYWKPFSHRDIDVLWKTDIARWLKECCKKPNVTETDINYWDARLNNFAATKEELDSFCSFTGWKTK